ncbi:uncharacterized protein L969DRAFT_95794 [Mixia osmundae IAM 14324]|uniref:Uncharacterized protein n=1 Tax=Mixia osmundae (strain CBS 9802 / IAM 14324 / JCM 22182 / KY 12970) TaxID=764103 RepID=G7DSJ8_MIXOS|nr:uncharacterized protein L969DRAFT_95794 [Mixia osmundae IAM 14324]KEI37945.1 hypothetical protein L969DRAFT_95794 [Mixia osmundae IAM 14324]GAA93558.1 hypothetical protein E5Q_00202 [Mixia osmundae IAM 14324]
MRTSADLRYLTSRADPARNREHIWAKRPATELGIKLVPPTIKDQATNCGWPPTFLALRAIHRHAVQGCVSRLAVRHLSTSRGLANDLDAFLSYIPPDCDMTCSKLYTNIANCTSGNLLYPVCLCNAISASAGVSHCEKCIEGSSSVSIEDTNTAEAAAIDIGDPDCKSPDPTPITIGGNAATVRVSSVTLSVAVILVCVFL